MASERPTDLTLLKPVRDNDGNDIGAIERQISKWSNANEVDKHVRYTDRVELKRLAGKEITSDLPFQIRRHVAQTLDFLRGWVELQKHAPNQGPSARRHEIENLKKQLLNLKEGALADLEAFRQKNPSRALVIAAELCETAVNRIGDLFEPQIPIPSSEPA